MRKAADCIEAGDRSGKMMRLAASLKQIWDDHVIEQWLAIASPQVAQFTDKRLNGEYQAAAVVGPNGSGKTAGGFIADCLYHRDHAPANNVWWVVSTNPQVSRDSAQKTIWTIMPKRMFGKHKWDEKNGFGSKYPMIKLDRGDRGPITIYFRQQTEWEADPKAFEGATVHNVSVDESIEHECFGLLNSRLIRAEHRLDGRIGVYSIGNEFWMQEEFEDTDKESRFFMRLEPSDNPIMTKTMFQRLIESVPEHHRDMRIGGLFAQAGDIVYREFSKDTHVVTATEAERLVQFGRAKWYAGLDVGAAHPTAFILIARLNDGRLLIYDEYKAKNTSPAEMTPEILAVIGNRKLDSPTRIDPAAFQTPVGSVATGSAGLQFLQSGLQVMKAPLTSVVKEVNQVAWIKDCLRNEDLLISDNCVNTIKEFRAWRYKTDRHGRYISLGSPYEDRNNDFLDAVRYCFSAFYLGGQLVEDRRDNDAGLDFARTNSPLAGLLKL